MRNISKLFLVLLSLFSFYPIYLYGVIEQAKIVNPDNLRSHNFEINVTPPKGLSNTFKFELSGIDSVNFNLKFPKNFN